MTPRNLSLDFHPPASHRTDPLTSLEAEHGMTLDGTRKRQAYAVWALVTVLPGNTARELWRVAMVREELIGVLPDLYAVRRRLTDLEAWGMVKKGEPRLARLPGAKRREVTWWPV